MISKKIGAGIFAIDKKTGKVLLARRGMNSGYPNTWATFGGTFEEEDVTPKQTAKREFWEETGIVEPYEISTKPFYIDANPFFEFYTYIGVFDGQPKVEINEESLGYVWVDLENIPFNLIPGLESMLKEKGEEIKALIDKLLDSNY